MDEEEKRQLAAMRAEATPKGLRHSFDVCNVQAGVPLNLLKKWFGHARLSTTEIYAEAVGAEERAITGPILANILINQAAVVRRRLARR